DRLQRPVGQTDGRPFLSKRLLVAALDLAMFDGHFFDGIVQRHALVAKDGRELRVVESLAEEAVLPAFAPEAVAAFDPESLTAGREIRDRELGFRSDGAGPRRNASRPRHRVDKGLHDAVRVAKIAVDIFPFDGKAATLEQAVDAEGVDTLRNRIHEL